MGEINFKFNTDKWTSLLYKALDTLLLKSPEKTSFGVIVGFILSGSREAMISIFEGKFSLFLSKINGFTLVLIGVAIIRIDIIFKGDLSDNELDKKMRNIKKIVAKGNFSESEKRQIYRDAVNLVLQSNETQKV